MHEEWEQIAGQAGLVLRRLNGQHDRVRVLVPVGIGPARPAGAGNEPRRSTGPPASRHRATTAHLCSTYPFAAEIGLGVNGVYLGSNLLTGGGGFAFDPFEAYTDGIVTNPNMLIAGEPGVGKSATAKTFIHRSVGVFGRQVTIIDPKGEYLPLAEALGLSVVKLQPGGWTRINPLDPGPARSGDATDRVHRQSEMLATLLGSG